MPGACVDDDGARRFIGRVLHHRSGFLVEIDAGFEIAVP